MIISICGKSGSGKSTLTNELLKHFGDKAIHIDVDKIGHYVNTIPEVLNEEVKCFGEGIKTNGIVDRKKLGKIVFSSNEEMDKLTEITWKYMEKEIDKVIETNPDKLIILDWQLTPRTKFFEQSDLTILLDIPVKIRKERIIKRDNISPEKFDIREQASIDYSLYNFDIVQSEMNIDEIKRMVKL